MIACISVTCITCIAGTVSAAPLCNWCAPLHWQVFLLGFYCYEGGAQLLEASKSLGKQSAGAEPSFPQTEPLLKCQV